MSAHLQSYLPEGHNAALLFVDTAGAAKLLNVSASFLNKVRGTGGGPPYMKIGKKNVRYSVSALLDWAAAQSRASTSDRSEIA